jgi:hypothetical protein
MQREPKNKAPEFRTILFINFDRGRLPEIGFGPKLASKYFGAFVKLFIPSKHPLLRNTAKL